MNKYLSAMLNDNFFLSVLILDFKAFLKKMFHVINLSESLHFISRSSIKQITRNYAYFLHNVMF